MVDARDVGKVIDIGDRTKSLDDVRDSIDAALERAVGGAVGFDGVLFATIIAVVESRAVIRPNFLLSNR